MTTKRTPAKAGALRRRAETHIRKNQSRKNWNQSDAERLLHELEVHQIELKMQIAELREAKEEIEVALEMYTDLYDFAPVGYFSLDDQGVILEANLRAASTLGIERSKLINQRFLYFLPQANRRMFQIFLKKVFAGAETQAWEGFLLTPNRATVRADFKATRANSTRGARKWCRMAVMVMTAEAHQRHIDELASNNRELNLEIAGRHAVEEALRKSEQHQAKLLEQSRYMEEQLRYLSHQILLAQEQERKRISRDLHDVVAQSLVSINVHLDALTRETEENPRGLKQNVLRTQKLVAESVRIVHQFARELRPAALDDLGLIPALQAFMSDFMKQTGIQVRFTTFAGVEKLDNDQQTALYRVAQEALTNVARHAQATMVETSIECRQGVVCMQIKDNGKSFEAKPISQAGNGKSLGLLGIRERMQMVGGSFEMAAAPGEGTTLRVQIPVALNRKAARPRREARNGGRSTNLPSISPPG